MQASLLAIESIAAIFSLWCVYLAGKNRILNWPISMIASVLYFGVFYENRFYSDAYLQVIFFIFQSYGWYSWIQQSKLKNHSNSNNHPSIRSLTPKLLLISIPLFFVFWGCYYFAYLQLFDNPRAPLIDTFLTSVSLLALYWQAKRFIENWHLWIVADLLYVPLYFWGGQYITALLYTIFIGLAFWGWKSWKKEKATH